MGALFTEEKTAQEQWIASIEQAPNVERISVMPLQTETGESLVAPSQALMEQPRRKISSEYAIPSGEFALNLRTEAKPAATKAGGPAPRTLFGMPMSTEKPPEVAEKPAPAAPKPVARAAVTQFGMPQRPPLQAHQPASGTGSLRDAQRTPPLAREGLRGAMSTVPLPVHPPSAPLPAARPRQPSGVELLLMGPDAPTSASMDAPLSVYANSLERDAHRTSGAPMPVPLVQSAYPHSAARAPSRQSTGKLKSAALVAIVTLLLSGFLYGMYVVVSIARGTR
jgi:hypothetical protein